ARARLQHEACHAAHGNVGANAADVDHDEGAIEDIDFASFHENDRDAVPDGEGFEGRKQLRHGNVLCYLRPRARVEPIRGRAFTGGGCRGMRYCALATLSRPQQKLLAGPMPCVIKAVSAGLSTTRISPSKVTATSL